MRLVAIDLTGRDPELVADRCWQAGATGLWEVDDSLLRAGVKDGDLPSFVDALADLAPVDVTEAEAVELAGRRSILEAAGRTVELWVPATVFGDGTHPTTATCLALLPDIVTTGATVLDVGCGAGALSIAAGLLGCRVQAIDIDPGAVAATADNAARNDVSVAVSSTALADVRGHFEVVLANLTVGALSPILPDLVRCTEPGGSLVLSGMLEEQWTDVRQEIAGSVTTERVVDTWVTAVVDPAP